MPRSPTSYGRYQVAEAPSALLSLHLHHEGIVLREVDHEPKNAVLDQGDLTAQGILCSQFIPGAGDPDALGSCTFNANTSALSNVLPKAEYLKVTGAKSYEDTVGLEKFAIRSYHAGTDQTGQPAQEWPPTDCGSSGPFIVEYDQRNGWVSGQQIAHGAQNIVSLMQSGGLLMGSPFFNSWEEPDSGGFVDGNGTASDLQAAIRSGVAGGHETFPCAIEKLAVYTLTGLVIPQKTVLRVRNSWTAGWGDHGDYRIHLSTVVALGQYIDLRQLVAV